ncbi:MAG: phospholipase [Candidatus Aminicenantes bacterium]|nr:phospholipase [Candidatus Aminicenantes bacterium]
MPAERRSRVFSLLPLLASAAFFAAAAPPDFEVVTTIPVETAISPAGTRSAADVWPEMIRGARRTLDIAEFYLSGRRGEALEPVIRAVLAAGRRRVRVRILTDVAMAAVYPDTLARFQGRPNIMTRLFDWRKLTGGVLHAKYFVVDNREAFLGSQNFDWRSLRHIQETGLRIRDPLCAEALGRIFEADWNYSAGDGGAYDRLSGMPALRFPADAFLAASPARFNPPGVAAALPTLVGLIDSARCRIAVQLLSYSVEGGREAGRFTVLERALRRAAGRNVRVSLLVSNWSLRPSQIAGLKDLARIPGIEVRFAVIPPSGRGFIPYARVIHSKVVRVDEDLCWVGTSNWGHDYFFRSRNVEVVLRRPGIARVLDKIFASLWDGPYAHKLDPDREYRAPRIN